MEGDGGRGAGETLTNHVLKDIKSTGTGTKLKCILNTYLWHEEEYCSLQRDRGGELHLVNISSLMRTFGRPCHISRIGIVFNHWMFTLGKHLALLIINPEKIINNNRFLIRSSTEQKLSIYHS